MTSRETALIGGLILLAAGFFYFGYLFRGAQAIPAQQQNTQTTTGTSIPTQPPTITPAVSEIEDNPERIENDDNPGESNRRGRGRD